MTYYELLQVSPEASTEVIDASWRALMKKYHPDKNKGNADLAKKLNEAHDVLSNPEKRAVYDYALNNGAHAMPGEGSSRRPGETLGEWQFRMAQEQAKANGHGRRRRGSRAYPSQYDGVPPRRSFSEDQVLPEEVPPENDLMRNLLNNLAQAGQLTLMDALTRMNEAAIETIDQDPVLRVIFGRNK